VSIFRQDGTTTKEIDRKYLPLPEGGYGYIGAEILPETLIEVSFGGSASTDFSIGQYGTYRVTWDGQVYECRGAEDANREGYIGNRAIRYYETYKDTQEPFYITNNFGIYTNSPGDTHTVKIECLS
jgi:hypothetical protein